MGEPEQGIDDVKVKIGKVDARRDTIVAGRDVILTRVMSEEYGEWMDDSGIPLHQMPFSTWENLSDHPDFEVEDFVDFWKTTQGLITMLSNVMPRGMPAVPTYLFKIYFELCGEMGKVGKGDLLDSKHHEAIMAMKRRIWMREAASRIILELRDFSLYLIIPIWISVWYVKRTPWLNEIAVEIWNSTG